MLGHTMGQMANDPPDEVFTTCPMHPEIIRSDTGRCPKCGMNLIPSGSLPMVGQRLGATEISASSADPLDRQYAELIELVWSCERHWAVDDRIDAAINYGRG